MPFVPAAKPRLSAHRVRSEGGHTISDHPNLDTPQQGRCPPNPLLRPLFSLLYRVLFRFLTRLAL